MQTIINNLLSSDELQEIRQLLETARWTAGHESAGDHARPGKHNEEMDQSCEAWKTINQRVVNKLYAHPEFHSAALPAKVSAAFVSRCSPGMYYREHVDDPVMGTPGGRYRSDVAVTIFISDAGDYEGGELSIDTALGPIAVKGTAGSAVLYPASSRHQVTEIKSGQRIVCVLWVQSLVRDPAQREILNDLDSARQALRLSAPEAEVTKTVDHAYINLVRMWSEV
ncbi:MAG: Fe2+-dependent dioxygenase [Granulosicoccus sp.]|nr:Fe2+-dependent dioxygenase [Granulosicoccus sp.]